MIEFIFLPFSYLEKDCANVLYSDFYCPLLKVSIIWSQHLLWLQENYWQMWLPSTLQFLTLINLRDTTQVFYLLHLKYFLHLTVISSIKNFTENIQLIVLNQHRVCLFFVFCFTPGSRSLSKQTASSKQNAVRKENCFLLLTSFFCSLKIYKICSLSCDKTILR